ncbi:MAG: DUF4876 domain-containing protein [Bacteroidales bacterium]|nr:DUF4876 domain-containing protein [Bacteroidales bacterium]
MRRHLLPLTVFALAACLMTGCRLQEVPFTNAVIHLSLPDEALPGGYDGYQVTLTNIATGRSQSDSTDAEGVTSIRVEEGVYKIEVSGVKTLETTVNVGSSQQTITQKVQISGLLEKALVIGETFEATIPLFVSLQSNGFVIKEIYYTGSTTPKSGSYYQDQYIEIYNNSDSVLYADGLTIVESTHLSSKDVPEFVDYPNDLIAGVLYTVPGDGTTYPVQPGKSIVIASLGINHTAVNANSPADLSKADFEWFDNGTDVDVPEVTNMIRAFCYSNTIWIMHVKGYHAYAIFKPESSISDFVTQNTVNVMTASGSTVTRVKVPNSMILDGVELGTAGTIGSKSLSSSIDVSYTYCDGSYIGKSVRRKVLKWENGRVILQDTNNSAKDFIPNATPIPWKVEEE